METSCRGAGAGGSRTLCARLSRVGLGLRGLGIKGFGLFRVLLGDLLGSLGLSAWDGFGPLGTRGSGSSCGRGRGPGCFQAAVVHGLGF